MDINTGKGQTKFKKLVCPLYKYKERCMIKNNRNKGWILTCTALTICLSLTGCYPDGRNLLDADKEIEEDYKKDIDRNGGDIECELDDGLYVNADLNINRETEWKEKYVHLKNWDIEKVTALFGNGKKITETKIMPNMHNDKINDQYIYWDDKSMLIIQQGNLQYYTEKELDYAYLGYLYGTMPYLTDETLKKFPETEISGISKLEAIEQVKEILKEIGVDVSEPRVYALTYERLEENTDYSQTDPDGNLPHKWSEEDSVYAIAFNGTVDSHPITEVGYRSGPAAGERIVGIVGKQGLVAFKALNIYEVEETNQLSEKILDVEMLLNNIRNKFRNILITDKIEIDKINLEYVPVLENLKKGEYKLKPMYICMARQEIERTQDKEEKNAIEENSIFPIIFDAQTGMEIQIGGTF